TRIGFKISAFLADAPARSFVKQCALHNAYYGCERCIDKGTWHGRVTFQSYDSELRTDESFTLKENHLHHNDTTPLLGLRLGLVTEFPLDHMHLVFLGVVKKLLKSWLKG